MKTPRCPWTVRTRMCSAERLLTGPYGDRCPLLLFFWCQMKDKLYISTGGSLFKYFPKYKGWIAIKHPSDPTGFPGDAELKRKRAKITVEDGMIIAVIGKKTDVFTIYPELPAIEIYEVRNDRG